MNGTLEDPRTNRPMWNLDSGGKEDPWRADDYLFGVWDLLAGKETEGYARLETEEWVCGVGSELSKIPLTFGLLGHKLNERAFMEYRHVHFYMEGELNGNIFESGE